jgi:hypothetical protein
MSTAPVASNRFSRTRNWLSGRGKLGLRDLLLHASVGQGNHLAVSCPSKKLIACNDNSNAAMSIQLLTSPDPHSRVYKLPRRFLSKMQPLTSNANRVLCDVQLRLLALSVAIPGLVLAPLGRVG